MNPKSLMWSVIALALWLAIPVAAQSQAAQSAEPQYQDRPLSSWVKDLESSDKRTRLVAADAISKMGPEAKSAIPVLIKLVGDPEKSVRMSGIVALARMGAEAKPALPILRQIANDPDPNISKAAHLAVEAIEPSFKTKASEWLTSESAIWAGTIGTLAVVVIAGLVLIGRRGREPKRAQKAQKPRETKPAATKAETAAAPQPAPERQRVSQALPGYGDSVRGADSAETVKRTLNKAQEEFKKVSERQVEIGHILGSKEIAGNPDRLLQLRSESEKLASEHYWHEVRTKGLEVKLLDLLMSNATTAGTELRVRSAGALRQKWDELGELCRNPAKVMWEGGQWTRRPVGDPVEIDDLRLHLVEYGVSLPEGFDVEPPAAAAAAAEEPAVVLPQEEPPAEADSQA